MTFIPNIMITGQLLPGGTHSMMTTQMYIFFCRKGKYAANLTLSVFG
jgi:hypothetical protein